jgi:hypothetical protein
MTKGGRDSRKRNMLAAAVAIPMVALLAYQAISDLVHGRIGGENYYGQPVGPALQLIVLAALAVVGTVLGWHYLFGKPMVKDKEKKRNRSRENKYPHEQVP